MSFFVLTYLILTTLCSRFHHYSAHFKDEEIEAPERLYNLSKVVLLMGFLCGSAGKESAWNVGDLGLIPGLGRSPGEGKVYPLQYSGLENSMNCIVHGVAKSQIRLRDVHFQFQASNWSSQYLKQGSRRRQWHPTPVLLPANSHGQRSLVGCSPWGHEELDPTEQLHFHFSLSCTGEGNGNPLQCSCLENPRGRGAWWSAVSGVAQSWTRLKWLSSSSQGAEHIMLTPQYSDS